MLINRRMDPSFEVDITTASLASGAARSSDFIENVGRRQGAKVTFIMSTGAAAPQAGTIYELWLLRREGPSKADDDVGVADAAYPVPPTLPLNATLLGSLAVTNDADQEYTGTFDTGPAGPLGEFYAFAIANRTDQAADATESDSGILVETYSDEIDQSVLARND